MVGAVSLCPHGTRPAELTDVKAMRMLAHAPGLRLDPCTLSPRDPHTGTLLYQPIENTTSDPLAALHTLQQTMLAAEQQLSHGYASAVPIDEQDDREWLTTLSVQDGTLRGKARYGAVVGCVKTIQTMYLPPDRASLLAELKPGERTPILHMQYNNKTVTRFIWYVRLSEAAFYQHPMSGVMRLEMYAPDEPDFLLPIVKQVANLSGNLLLRLAATPTRTPAPGKTRFPRPRWNRRYGRSMGSAELAQPARFGRTLLAPFRSGGIGMTGMRLVPPLCPIGMVLGTEDATPTIFWFAVMPGSSVQLDDLVVVQTHKPDGQPVNFYGLVDSVRKRHEGIAFESDVADVVAGVLPAAVSYAARVLVTRVSPEDFIPPQPGDLVAHARGEALHMALSADKMEEAAFPAGLLADGQTLPLNFRFINGESGGHINISGISGVATKTSYALFLLHSIFRSGVMDRVAAKSGGQMAGTAGGRAISTAPQGPARPVRRYRCGLGVRA